VEQVVEVLDMHHVMMELVVEVQEVIVHLVMDQVH
tara:strand:- start:27 stop:131 length:105 start_codon:yes stop_codon:yes gene_type:complete